MIRRSWLAACVVLAPGSLAAQGAESLRVPAGFSVEIFADSLAGARGLAFGPDGALYVTMSRAGSVVRLVDQDADGRADRAQTLIEGLSGPFGIRWRGSELWVAETGRVLRITDATNPPVTTDVMIDSLPAGGQHWTRTLAFDPSGRYVFVSVGSSCNVCEEEDERRAAVLRFRLDGSEWQVWARGLRNSVGLAIHPETGELWATENGRDWLGDDLPPDELNALRRGWHYGWPQCYGTRVPNPEYADDRLCAGTQPPILTFPAHTAPLGIAFYTGDVFPEEYRGDAFVALHGSWNRSVPVGYKVVRVRVRAGRPFAIEDFVTGWLAESGEAWGRPVEPLVGPDGALYVSDDRGGRIWRVAYVGSRGSR